MITEWQKECLSLLAEMRSDNTWTRGKAQIYAYILENLGEQASRRSVQWAIENTRWRPEPAELREIAANLYSPLPPPGELWRELWYKATTQGYDRPRWSHPILEDLVDDLGGWKHLRSICWPDSDPGFQGALQRRFDQAYEAARQDWWRAVADQLSLPPAERDPRYFPTCRRWLPPAEVTGNTDPIREEVRERLRELGAGRIGVMP